MRIISKFFDYYDKGIAFGIDPKQVYVRETKEITFEVADKARRDNELFNIMDEMPDFSHFYMTGTHIYNGVIGFCGRAFPWWQVHISCGQKFIKTYYSIGAMTDDINGNTFEENVANRVLESSGDKIKQALHFQIKELRNNLAIFHNRKYKVGRYYTNLLGMKPKEFEAKYIGSTLPDELFIKYNAPIMMVIDGATSNILTLNPRLNDYNFITQVDPISAFQEIAMYLGNNMAVQNDPSDKFSDELKINSHGFDKWSFRKEGKGKK